MEENLAVIIRNIRKAKGVSTTQLSYITSFSSSYLCDLEKKRRIGNEETYKILFHGLGYNYELYIRENEILSTIIDDILHDIIFLTNMDCKERLNRIFTIQNKYKFTMYENEIRLLQIILNLMNEKNIISDEVHEGCNLINDIQNETLISLFNLCRLDYLKEKTEIIKELKTILDSNVNKTISGIAYYKLAEIKGKEERCIEALRLCNKSKDMFLQDMNMNQLYILKLHMGNIFMRIKDIRQALKIFKELIVDKQVKEFDLVYSAAVNNYIWTIFLCDNYEKTIYTIKELVSVYNEIHHYMLIWSYLLTNQKHECYRAIQDLRKTDIKIEDKLYILIAMIENIENPLLENKIAEFVKLLEEENDFYTKITGFKLLCYYYESRRKYKYALYYSKLLCQTY